MLNRILNRTSSSPGAAVMEMPPAPAAPAAEPVYLSIPRWSGRKRVCCVKVLENDEEAITVWSPQRLKVDSAVWIDSLERSIPCSVRGYVASAGGYRMMLERRGEDRRATPRFDTNMAADLEWTEGLNRCKCAVRVTNVSEDGAQVTLARPAPGLGAVRLQIGGQVHEGAVRYCVQIGASYLAGIQFV